MAEDMGEKTEDPTPRRKSEARKEGQIAKSQDLTAAVMMIGATTILAFFGGRMFLGMAEIVRYNLSPERLGRKLTVGSSKGDLLVIGAEVMRLTLPVALLMFVVTLLAVGGQVGLMFSSKSITPDLKKINPIGGLKKLLSKRSLVKAGLDALKFLVLALTATLAIRLEWDVVSSLTQLSVLNAVVEAAWLVLKIGIVVLLLLVLLALVDFVYQRWQHTEDLKMTKHEVKDERKSMEGDPEVRKRRAKMAQQILGQRLQQDVPGADVVVTNPTHFSVALKYDAGAMGAPVVVAKGADYVALRIRQIASASGVPIVERPPLARALYGVCAVGDEVPESSYEAVAEVLAFVYELEGRGLEEVAG